MDAPVTFSRLSSATCLRVETVSVDARRQFGALLYRLARLSAIDERGPGFRSRAFDRALWALDRIEDFESGSADVLVQVEGIGPGTAGLIREFRDTGRLRRLDTLADRYPAAADVLSRARSATPARLRDMKTQLGIESIEDFASALDAGALLDIKGVGPSTIAVWERWVEEVVGMATPQWVALPLAARLAAHATDLVGEDVRAVRRVEPWTDVVTLVGSQAVRVWLDTTALLVEEHSDRLHHGPRVEVIATAPAPNDQVIVSDLHVHSTWSRDGRQNLGSIIESATALGLAAVAITDHGPDLHFGGMSEADLDDRRLHISNDQSGIELLEGAELNIGPDGSLDFDEVILSGLDVVVGGVHSYFDLDCEEQTERVTRAIRNPHLKVLAHPTGRRVGIRPRLRLNLEAIFDAAAETGTALEINGHLDRLDLDVDLARRAHRAGCLLATNSDAHQPSDFRNLTYALQVAFEAGIPTESIVNTWEMGRLRTWLADR